MARKFASKTPTSAKDAELNFPTLHLGWLFRFAVFVRDGEGNPLPLSFRAFMKGQGSHRTMVKAVDAIEWLAGRLLIARVFLDGQGQHAGHTDSYSETLQRDTKRVGLITPHGRAWAEFGDYVGDLLDMAVQTEDAEELRRFMADSRRRLDEYRSRAEERSARQKE